MLISFIRNKKTVTIKIHNNMYVPDHTPCLLGPQGPAGVPGPYIHHLDGFQGPKGIPGPSGPKYP